MPGQPGGLLDANVGAREADEVRDLADDLKRVQEAAKSGMSTDILAVLHLPSVEGDWTRARRRWTNRVTVPSPPTATISTRWQSWADLESDGRRFPA